MLSNKITLTPTDLGKHLMNCPKCSKKFTEIITHQVMGKRKQK